jgi:hypothetical protein
VLGIAGLLFLVLVSVAHAQSTASLSGTVKDTTSALVPEARIVLTNEASKASSCIGKESPLKVFARAE